MDTWLEIGGLAIHSPVTALTNLVLTVQCWIYYRRLRNGSLDGAGYWSLFFLAMAATTLGGVPKHGFKDVMSAELYSTVLWISCLGSGVAVYCAQHATLVSHRLARTRMWSPGLPGRGDWLGVLPAMQAAAYLGAATLWGPEMLLTAANTALGLSPIMVVEAVRLRRGPSVGGWVLAGLGVSLFTGVVYVGHLSMGVWFNHVDLAHVLMGISFWLMVRGAGAHPVVASSGPRSAGIHVGEAVETLAADLGGRA